MSEQAGATDEAARAARISVRKAEESHLPHISDLDAWVTGVAKPEYWADIYERYATRRIEERFFLIAESADKPEERPVLGYVIGEVRAWEFGSEPCGWVFAFSVDPRTRLQGIGEALLEAITEAFREAGIETMRTMVPRSNNLHMAFFRSEGMTAGPYVQLEKEIE